MMVELTKNELEDIAYGAALLGEGHLEASLTLIKAIANPVQLIDYQQVEPDTWGAVIAGLGANQAPNQQKVGSDRELFEALIPTLLKTFNLLEKMLNRTFSYTLGLEIGANLFPAILIASHRGIPIVDGDGAGRAVPELEMTTYASQGISVSPTALSNVKLEPAQQIEMIVSAKTSALMEQPIRNLVSTNEFTTRSARIAIVAAYAMSDRILQEKLPIIPGTISLAREVGSALRQAKDPVEAVLNFFDRPNRCQDGQCAFKLFQGTVDKVEQKYQGGFGWYIATISNDNQQLRVLAKNENLIAWCNDSSEPIAMGPDTICYLSEDGTPLGIRELKPGTEVTVLGVKAFQQLRRGSILESFLKSLQEWGYYGPYIPIEKIHNRDR